MRGIGALAAFLAIGTAQGVAGQAGGDAETADRVSMMRTLGITALVPGFNGDPTGPGHANYDEARANPYPHLPDPLRRFDGARVTTAAQWPARRAEIAAVYEREVYGRVPDGVPAVRWQVVATDRETIGFSHPVIARRVIGIVRDPAGQGRDVRIRMLVVLPADAGRRVPVLMMFGRDTFPAPSQPTPEEIDRIDAALKAAAARADPSLAPVFAAHQAFALASSAPFRLPERDVEGNPPPADQLIAAGWGYAMLDPQSAQADNGAGLSRGIIGLVDRGAPRRPDQWGALRAWAWAASRGLDWLQADPGVDGRHVGIEGVSRFGKAALDTMAFDPRFAVGLIGSSGKGGTTPLRRNFGEGVGNLATASSYWMAGNFLRYDTKGVSRPGLDADDLPVDANELIALAAPRPLFVSFGAPEAGDAHWLDHLGSYRATLDAARVYRLLGEHGPDDRANAETAVLPPIGSAQLGGALAWRQHAGGHTDAPNVKYFLQWADQFVHPRS